MTNTPRKLRIGVDIDGVLFPFVDSLCTHAVTSLGRSKQSLPAPTQWDFSAAWGMTSAELVELMHDGVDNGALLLDEAPYPGVVAGLGRLRAAGHTVHLVTDRAWLGRREQAAEARTVAWLERNKVPHDTLHFTKDKTAVPTDVFIDDRPENYEALAGAGVDVFLRGHAYNAHVRTPPGRRVRDFTTFTARVLNLAA